MKDLIGTIIGGSIGLFMTVGYVFSVPCGIYYGWINGSLFNLLCSIFVPYYGIIYAIINWVS